MTQNIHTRIKHLLEETSDAFASSGTINMDYAGFAAMALSDFKSLLDNPDLTDMELRRMIRKGEKKRRVKDPEGCWSSFIARYVAKNANQNQNLKDIVRYNLDDIYKEKP